MLMSKDAYYYGTGRRKSAVARVRLFASPGVSLVNGKEAELTSTVSEVFEVIGKEGKYHLEVHVAGGGKQAQLEAIRHGTARALLALNPDTRSVLRTGGFLTQDSRV